MRLGDPGSNLRQRDVGAEEDGCDCWDDRREQMRLRHTASTRRERYVSRPGIRSCLNDYGRGQAGVNDGCGSTRWSESYAGAAEGGVRMNDARRAEQPDRALRPDPDESYMRARERLCDGSNDGGPQPREELRRLDPSQLDQDRAGIDRGSYDNGSAEERANTRRPGLGQVCPWAEEGRSGDENGRAKVRVELRPCRTRRRKPDTRPVKSDPSADDNGRLQLRLRDPGNPEVTLQRIDGGVNLDRSCRSCGRDDNGRAKVREELRRLDPSQLDQDRAGIDRGSYDNGSAEERANTRRPGLGQVCPWAEEGRSGDESGRGGQAGVNDGCGGTRWSESDAGAAEGGVGMDDDRRFESSDMKRYRPDSHQEHMDRRGDENVDDDGRFKAGDGARECSRPGRNKFDFWAVEGNPRSDDGGRVEERVGASRRI